MEALTFLWAIFLIVLLLALYFLPSVVAVNRRHKNRTPIILLNLFLGWFVVGWVVALIWAFTANTESA